MLKGSRERERRGVGKVPNVHNMSLTEAIDVLFSVNFAVVFDFMYSISVSAPVKQNQ